MDQQALALEPGEIMTRDEAAALLRVHAHTLARWRYTDEGPPFHQPRGKRARVVYFRSELLAWLRGAA
jgi:hypothetical protein